jgi:hypothetical protein
MVPLYSSCQWTAAGTFGYGGETENPKFGAILIRVFLQPVQGQTDRHLIKGSYVLIHINVAKWRKVYFFLAILTA